MYCVKDRFIILFIFYSVKVRNFMKYTEVIGMIVGSIIGAILAGVFI